jgi:hypothetical protein
VTASSCTLSCAGCRTAWRRHRTDNKVIAPDPSENIYVVPDAPDWFKQREDKVAAIDLDKQTDDRVALRGAFLIDRYRSEAQLDLHWPLIRLTEYRKGTTTYSELTINRRKTVRAPLYRPTPTTTRPHFRSARSTRRAALSKRLLPRPQIIYSSRLSDRRLAALFCPVR